MKMSSDKTQGKGKNPNRAAGYIRVSQERSVANGYGLGAQEQDIKRYVDYKRLNLIDIYSENGVSGYITERPAMERLLADARAGSFDIVLFPSIDRAGRSVRDVIDIDQTLRSEGIDTVFLREGVDTSTATGQLFRNIMASLAEFEGRLIYERLTKGKQRKASGGGYIGGWIAYGYRWDASKQIVVNPDEASVVRRIYRWRIEGLPFDSICKRLMEEGVPTLRGGKWRTSTVRGILTNRFYTGRTEFEGKFVLGLHEAIVSDSTFRRCQQAMKKFGCGRRRNRKPSSQSPSSGNRIRIRIKTDPSSLFRKKTRQTVEEPLP